VIGIIESQRAATARYNKKTYDRIEIFVRKGKKQVIKEFAQKQGKSTNKFINEAIEKAMAEQEGDA
jgi:predicted HicB family RNase H-like nuclease